jgi:two-component system CheB/CheR fusion protein
LRIRPYRTQDHKIDGAVLALFDVDEFKRSVEQMGEIMWEAFLALDRELRVIKANGAFYEMFQVSREATEGKFIYDLGSGQWNIPRLRNLLEDVLPAQSRIRNFSVEHVFPQLGRRKMLLNARRLEGNDSTKELILLAIEDVTAA